MLSSLLTFLKNEVFHGIHKETNTDNAKNQIIYRDELSKTTFSNKIPAKANSVVKPIKKRYSDDSIERSEPLIDDKGSSSANIRVKVTMTKREANRLLSKCKEGGVLEFRDVARELVNLPANRVVVVPNPPPNSTNGTVLKTIPEEF